MSSKIVIFVDYDGNQKQLSKVLNSYRNIANFLIVVPNKKDLIDNHLTQAFWATCCNLYQLTSEDFLNELRLRMFSDGPVTHDEWHEPTQYDNWLIIKTGCDRILISDNAGSPSFKVGGSGGGSLCDTYYIKIVDGKRSYLEPWIWKLNSPFFTPTTPTSTSTSFTPTILKKGMIRGCYLKIEGDISYYRSKLALVTRSFDTAECHRLLGETTLALHFYQHFVVEYMVIDEQKGDRDLVYTALIEQGRLSSNMIHYFKAYELDPQIRQAMYEIVRNLNQQKCYSSAYYLGRMEERGVTNLRDTYCRIDLDVKSWSLDFEIAKAAMNIGKKDIAKDLGYKLVYGNKKDMSPEDTSMIMSALSEVLLNFG